MRLVFVVLFVVALIVLGQKFIRNKKINITSTHDMNVMHDIIHIMDRFMKIYNVEYFLLAGTLLGGIRNNPPGVLYWDDDIDVGVLQTQVQNIELMIKDTEFIKHVEINRQSFGYQFYPKKHIQKNHQKKFIYDIFVHENVNNQYVMINGNFPKSIIPSIDYIYPITHKTFWDISLPYPNKPLQILQIPFGKDIMSKVQYYNHTTLFHLFNSQSKQQDVNKDNTTPLHIKHTLKPLGGPTL
jgi:hypothetical protein